MIIECPNCLGVGKHTSIHEGELEVITCLDCGGFSYVPLNLYRFPELLPDDVQDSVEQLKYLLESNTLEDFAVRNMIIDLSSLGYTVVVNNGEIVDLQNPDRVQYLLERKIIHKVR